MASCEGPHLCVVDRRTVYPILSSRLASLLVRIHHRVLGLCVRRSNARVRLFLCQQFCQREKALKAEQGTKIFDTWDLTPVASQSAGRVRSQRVAPPRGNLASLQRKSRAVLLCQYGLIHTTSQGLSTSTPKSAKSFALRVATARSWQWAVAAKKPSRISSGLPCNCRRTISSAH
jgi:hypothetical protein